MRKETKDMRYLSPSELKNSDAAFTFRQTVTRPLTMLVFEPIILFTAIYVSLAWSMVFFYFQAYPIIFKGMLLDFFSMIVMILNSVRYLQL